ncbi:MAG: hypothetical protein QW179_03810 [Candidatus Hadarchaeales archaeon]
MSDSELIATMLLSILLPVVLLAWPALSAPIDSTAKAMALLIPAVIAAVIAAALWWVTRWLHKKSLKSKRAEM